MKPGNIRGYFNLRFNYSCHDGMAMIRQAILLSFLSDPFNKKVSVYCFTVCLTLLTLKYVEHQRNYVYLAD